MTWCIVLSIVWLLCTGCVGPGSYDGPRSYNPMPERFIIDKPGKCEVRCERWSSTIKCKEYCC